MSKLKSLGGIGTKQNASLTTTSTTTATHTTKKTTNNNNNSSNTNNIKKTTNNQQQQQQQQQQQLSEWCPLFKKNIFLIGPGQAESSWLSQVIFLPSGFASGHDFLLSSKKKQ